jgi:hypothetical protein
MANIKLKPISELETWNAKELRKLRITIKNRMESLQLAKPKEISESHPLYSLEADGCQKLLEKVKRAEKAL